MEAVELLLKFEPLATRNRSSLQRLRELGESLSENPHVGNLQGTIFAAGSFGRLEAGPESDLDLFAIETGGPLLPLSRVQLLSSIAGINDDLRFPPIDPEMRFFKIYDASQLIDHTGKPIDDSENSFTTRMLMLLEGRPVIGQNSFAETVSAILENYFRDNKGKKSFKPLFLLNDLLRYWRTLCLNYEETRSDPKRKWRKKNLNLRFSRLATVFATVGVLLQFRPSSAVEFERFLPMTPFERIAACVDESTDAGLVEEFSRFLMHYEWFLALKDSAGGEQALGDSALSEARERADAVSNFFHKLLTQADFRGFDRYLIL